MFKWSQAWIFAYLSGPYGINCIKHQYLISLIIGSYFWDTTSHPYPINILLWSLNKMGFHSGIQSYWCSLWTLDHDITEGFLEMHGSSCESSPFLWPVHHEKTARDLSYRQVTNYPRLWWIYFPSWHDIASPIMFPCWKKCVFFAEKHGQKRPSKILTCLHSNLNSSSFSPYA